MLGDASILICEDEPFIALDLAMSVQEAGGRVLGPAASVREAMEILRFNKLTGAILDVNLADGVITPVVEQLLERSVPVVIQTGGGLPSELSIPNLGACLFSKPVAPERLIRALVDQMGTGRA